MMVPLLHSRLLLPFFLLLFKISLLPIAMCLILSSSRCGVVNLPISIFRLFVFLLLPLTLLHHIPCDFILLPGNRSLLHLSLPPHRPHPLCLVLGKFGPVMVLFISLLLKVTILLFDYFSELASHYNNLKVPLGSRWMVMILMRMTRMAMQFSIQRLRFQLALLFLHILHHLSLRCKWYYPRIKRWLRQRRMRRKTVRRRGLNSRKAWFLFGSYKPMVPSLREVVLPLIDHKEQRFCFLTASFFLVVHFISSCLHDDDDDALCMVLDPLFFYSIWRAIPFFSLWFLYLFMRLSPHPLGVAFRHAPLSVPLLFFCLFHLFSSFPFVSFLPHVSPFLSQSVLYRFLSSVSFFLFSRFV